MELKAGFRTLHTYPSEALRKKSAIVPPEKFNKALTDFISDMAGAMLQYGGVGLAAPQLGVHLRIICLRADVLTEAPPGVEFIGLVNPEIISTSPEREADYEGCLSFPGCFEKVERAKSIELRFLDPAGGEHTGPCTDYMARVVQHEIDHLDGKLLYDHLSVTRRNLVRRYAEKKYPNWQQRSVENIARAHADNLRKRRGAPAAGKAPRTLLSEEDRLRVYDRIVDL